MPRKQETPRAKAQAQGDTPNSEKIGYAQNSSMLVSLHLRNTTSASNAKARKLLKLKGKFSATEKR